MSPEHKVSITVDEKYMASLLTEELCGAHSPLGDLRVDIVSQNEDGTFEIAMAARPQPSQDTSEHLL